MFELLHAHVIARGYEIIVGELNLLGQDSESAEETRHVTVTVSRAKRGIRNAVAGEATTGLLCGALIRNTWLNFLRCNSQLLSV